jgi:hypothetical protein
MSIVTWDSFQSLTAGDLPGCPWLSIKEALTYSASEFCQRTKVWREVSPAIKTTPGVSDYVPTLPGILEHVWDVTVIGRHLPLDRAQSSYVHSNQFSGPQSISGITAVSNGNGTVTATAVYAGVPDVLVDGIVYINGDTSNQYNGSWTVTAASGNTISWIMVSATTPTAATGTAITGTNTYNMGAPIMFAQIDDATIRLYPTPDAAYTFMVNCCMNPARDSSTGVESFIYESYSEYIASGAIYRLAAKPIKKPWSNPDLAAYHKQNFENGINLALYKDTQGYAPRAKPRMF